VPEMTLMSLFAPYRRTSHLSPNSSLSLTVSPCLPFTHSSCDMRQGQPVTEMTLMSLFAPFGERLCISSTDFLLFPPFR
jgi:hypothetical protein